MPYAYPGATILREPAQSKCTWTCHKRHLCRNLQGKCHTLTPGPTFCASLRSRHAHGHVTRGILCRNKQGKFRTRIPGPAFCASLHSRHVHGHVTRGILCRNLQGKCGTRILGPAFCASLRSRHAHGHVTRGIVWKFTRKMPIASDTTSIEHRPLTVTVRTRQCGHTVWGKTLFRRPRSWADSQRRQVAVLLKRRHDSWARDYDCCVLHGENPQFWS